MTGQSCPPTLLLSGQLVTDAFIPNIYLPLTVSKQLCQLLGARSVKSVPEKLNWILGRARQRRESPDPAPGRTYSTSTSCAMDHPIDTNRYPGQSWQPERKSGHCTHSAGPHQGALEMERAEFSFKLPISRGISGGKELLGFAFLKKVCYAG